MKRKSGALYEQRLINTENIKELNELSSFTQTTQTKLFKDPRHRSLRQGEYQKRP